MVEACGAVAEWVVARPERDVVWAALAASMSDARVLRQREHGSWADHQCTTLHALRPEWQQLVAAMQPLPVGDVLLCVQERWKRAVGLSGQALPHPTGHTPSM